MPDFVDAPECTVRARVGDLTDNLDHWWSLAEPEIATVIVDKIASVLLPFVERNHSDEAIERTLAASGPVKYLRAPETVYLAILRNQRGDVAGACELLQRFHIKVLGAWKPKAQELIEEFNCQRLHDA